MNIKNIFAILFVFAILVAPVVAGAEQRDQKGIHEAGTGLEDPELKETVQFSGQGLESEDDDNNIEEGDDDGDVEDGDDVDEREMEKAMFKKQAVSRRSRVANSVQEIERIATRNEGVGEQIRVIAQNQNKIQEEAEGALERAQERGGLSRFIVGPNYGQLKEVEDRLERHNENLEELMGLREEIQTPSDQLLLDEQIQMMEEIKVELEEAVNEDQKGFSLFGWLNRLLRR